ncbi:class I SAM-dependent methyltransferase [Paenibacillus alginolyticus]|uniref:class I SAM-dependent methyltransferase n=1 Tax=Paenibacillus alginolyticus TaxID=59839 RepID=UPI0004282709|nr:class I SAM-dependent methyltransferase [Paenibacillus alginolyticus]MCY9667420.1 class I SAM-dependent methyltransferase [Paenibacillus alginolyticus]
MSGKRELLDGDFDYSSYLDPSSDKYKRRVQAYNHEYNRLKKYLPPQGRLLDIGCGIGSFSELFGDEWEKYGIEVSKSAKEIAIQKGINFDINSCEKGSFDLIVFRGSLHYMEPTEILSYSNMMLKRGGIIAFLATPNTSSIYYKLFKNLPFLEKDIKHYLISDKELRTLLERMNMDILEINKPYFNTPYARPIRDFLFFIFNLFGARLKFPFYGNMFELFARKRAVNEGFY